MIPGLHTPDPANLFTRGGVIGARSLGMDTIVRIISWIQKAREDPGRETRIYYSYKAGLMLVYHACKSTPSPPDLCQYERSTGTTSKLRDPG